MGVYLANLQSKLDQNPWYVLATLPGVGSRPAFFNDWCAQALSDEQRQLAQACGFQLESREQFADRRKGIEDAHRAEMARLNGADFDYPGLPDASQTVDLTGVVVSDKFDLGGLIIPNGLRVGDATFDGPMCLENALVFGVLDLSGATFHKSFRSKGLTVAGRTNGQATVFCGEALFTEAKFDGPVDFFGASFKGRAVFSQGTFSRAASFRNCVFDEDVNNRQVSFINTIFQAPADFRNARFCSNYPDFSGTILHERSLFTAKDKGENGPLWPPGRVERPADNIEANQQQQTRSRNSCAVIRHVFGRQGMPDEEHFFFRREMHYAARAEPFWRTAHIYAYEVLSNFGYSIMRPLGWIVLVWTIGAWVYAIRAAMGWGTGAAYSFATMFKFFGFQRTFLQKETGKLDAIAGMEMFAAGQTVLGFILMFFLGLGLRTRFRLR